VFLLTINGKSVLVTGGTGSFGQKFVEIALNKYNPDKIIVFSRDELKQYEMLLKFNDDPKLRFFLGDVRDKERLYRAFKDVDIVIETKKGHDLGRLIFEGTAEPETEIPGESEGVDNNKVINTPVEGIIKTYADIGDMVKKGQMVAEINNHKILAQNSGIVRGIIQNGSSVWKGLKVVEIDSEVSPEQCYRLSQRSRDIAGGVLEAVMYLKHEKDLNND